MSVQVREPQQRPYPAPAGSNGGRPTDGAAFDDAPATSPSAAVAAPGAPGASVSPGVPAGPAGYPAPDAVAAAEAPAARRRPRLMTRRVLLPVLAVIVIAAALFGFNTYREGQMYVTTENAQLTGQPVQVGAMNAGRVDTIMPSIGASVHKGDVVAQVSLPSTVGMGQNGQPKMGFLGAGDTRVDVQAPFDGVVIAEPVAVGATVAAGQAIVTIVDPTQLWVNANIEETNVGRLKVGQTVTVHVDALGTDIPGRVEAVTPATANTFSLLPNSNASGNFTKVTQLVPVRISVNLGNQPLLLGANVEVKIRVAD
jgi:multidrug resistance efflux pump